MSLFQFIKSTVSIADLVGEYVSLRSIGTYLKGCCPFHSEKTASFTVSPAKGIYYCFGCQESGDVISFLAKIENCSQIEAANELIERYNIQVPDELAHNKNSSHKPQLKALQNICSFFASWTSAQLTNSIAAEYLLARGVQIEKFQGNIGYFPQKLFNRFLQDALKSGFLADDLKKVGILVQGQSGLYCPFEERIIFFIKDHLGKPVAFGGRVFLKDDQRAKYYNSREHGAFKKGDLLYGLDRAKKSIQSQGNAILVEGYIDCLMMWQAGFENTVATLGTACSIEQLSLLSRYATTIYVMYDSDQAGINAMLRLVSLCWKVSLDMKVVSLPESVDPADFILAKGDVKDLLNAALDIYRYYILINGKSFSNKSFSERLEQINEILSVIEKVQDDLKVDLLLHEAAKAFDLPVTLLKKKPKAKIPQISPVHVESDNQINYESIPGLQKRFVSMLLYDISLYEPIFEIWAVGLDYPLDQVMIFIGILHKESRNWQDGVWDLDKKIIEFIHRLALEYDHKDGILNFDSIKQQFKRHYWKDIVKAFQKKIILAEQIADPDEVQRLLEKFQQLKATF
jgi:DNA primase